MGPGFLAPKVFAVTCRQGQSLRHRACVRRTGVYLAPGTATIYMSEGLIGSPFFMSSHKADGALYFVTLTNIT